MKKNISLSFYTFIAVFSSISLLASQSQIPQIDSVAQKASKETNSMVEDLDQDADPSSEELDTNVEEDGSSSNASSKKVLYDPKMNYGTGAPIPKPAPLSTAKKNCIAFATSVVLGTLAMLVVSSHKGSDAPGH